MRCGGTLLALIALSGAIAGHPSSATGTLFWSDFASGAENSGPGTSIAQSATPEEQRQREQYILRALQPPTDPALAGRKEKSTGTGFYVSDHTLVTNHHVISDCSVVTIQSAKTDTQSLASLIASDEPHDLALLKTATGAGGIAEFEARPERADASDLYIVGYPAHGMAVRRPELTPAVGKPGELTGTPALLRLSANVHPGHSGSPVLDEYGAVVGVVTKAVDTVATYAKTGRLVTKFGLAIPGSVVAQFLRQHQVVFRSEAPAASLTPADRIAQAQAFVVQVSCWQ